MYKQVNQLRAACCYLALWEGDTYRKVAIDFEFCRLAIGDL